jgi:queuine tRNA-ribosyltransferase
VTSYPNFAFAVSHRAPDSSARLGRLTTPHGTIDTPNFIFCATRGAIKGATMAQVAEAETDIVLANTYHLMIMPGADRVASMGGLHRMTGWSGPMLTDSGGFQIFSMGHGGVADEIKGRARGERATSLVKISEEGAEFRSYLNGEKLFLSPEASIQIQRKLGADLIVQLDECTPYHSGDDYIAKSMEMSMRWGDRCLAEFDRGANGSQALYGVIQGGTDQDLRRQSADYVRDRDFFGTAVGGTLGGDKAQMYGVVDMAAPYLHPDRPVHLLGIGNFVDVFEGVVRGMDTFDCVHPTRVARHGWALKKGVPGERVNLRNARFAGDPDPIDESCGCHTCQTFAAGYIQHLVKAGELTGVTLLTIHNIYTMNRLMRDVRRAIAEGTLAQAKNEWLGA